MFEVYMQNVAASKAHFQAHFQRFNVEVKPLPQRFCALSGLDDQLNFLPAETCELAGPPTYSLRRPHTWSVSQAMANGDRYQIPSVLRRTELCQFSRLPVLGSVPVHPGSTVRSQNRRKNPM